MTVTIDTSPAGSWRRARDPEGPSCKACGQNECGHSDAVFQGIVPPYLPDTGLDGFDDARGGLPDADRLAAPVLAPFHNPGDTP